MKPFGRILGWIALSLAWVAMSALAGAEVSQKSVSLGRKYDFKESPKTVAANPNPGAPASDPYLGFKPETDPNKKPLDMYSSGISKYGRSNPIISEQNSRFSDASQRTLQYQSDYRNSVPMK